MEKEKCLMVETKLSLANISKCRNAIKPRKKYFDPFIKGNQPGNIVFCFQTLIFVNFLVLRFLHQIWKIIAGARKENRFHL